MKRSLHQLVYPGTMGYSIGVRPRSQKLHQKMLAFFEKEYRPHWKIRGQEEQDCYFSPPTDDLSYISGNAIGINYNGGGFENVYSYNLVQWMALKVARTRRVFFSPRVRFPDPVPYMMYDGDPWPVLRQPLEGTPKNLRWCCVDEVGHSLSTESYDQLLYELDFAALQKARREACLKYGIDSDNWPIQFPEGTLWDIHNTEMEILEPLLWKVREPIRAELLRLDTAWNAF